MPAAIPHALPAASRRRSLLVTIFAWAVVGLAALLCPISLISLLMIMAGGPGTSTFDPVGFLTVVVGPPAFVVTGVGLLLRKKWAWYVMVAALAIVILINVVDLFRDHSVKERTYTSPSGVRTTEFSGGTPLYAVPILFICIPALVMLFLKRVRAEFASPVPVAAPANAMPPHAPPGRAAASVSPSSHSRNWQVGHVGRDEMYYEERIGDTWQRIPVSGEMLMGRAHHVIYFRSPAEWQAYPEWARGRRDEIIGRIKSEFRPPDYEYQGDGATGQNSDRPGVTSPAVPKPISIPAGKPAPAGRGLPASLIAIVLLLGVSAFTGWRVIDGLSQGATRLPVKFGSRRLVTQADDPALFYVSIALYAIVAIGALGLLFWGLFVAYSSKTDKGGQRDGAAR